MRYFGLWTAQTQAARELHFQICNFECQTFKLPVFQFSSPTTIPTALTNVFLWFFFSLVQAEPNLPPFTVPGSAMASIHSCLAAALAPLALALADCEAPSSGKALLQSKASLDWG